MADLAKMELKRRIERKYNKRRVECHICYMDTKYIITKEYSNERREYKRMSEIIKINEIDTRLFVDNIIPDESIFLCPCGVHNICKECLRQLVINKSLINDKHSLIRCLGNDDECETGIGMKYYFNHSDIKKVLTKKEYNEYIEHADQYRFPGYEVIKCPIYNYRKRRQCNLENLVSIENINNIEKGKLIITCDQSIECNQHWCYHCHRRVYDTNYCNYCLTINENKDPEAFNKYFYKEHKKKRYENIHYKNKELTVAIVLKQLIEKLESDKLEVRCFNCSVVIEKADQCNGIIDSCKIETCYSCGRSATKSMPSLKDHWQENGESGCPRWDTSGYWNNNEAGFKCIEEQCYSLELGSCKIQTHQYGIQNVIRLRKKAHIYHSLKSLLPNLRTSVIKNFPEKYLYYLPKQSTFDFLDKNSNYNTYSCYSELLLEKLYIIDF